MSLEGEIRCAVTNKPPETPLPELHAYALREVTITYAFTTMK